MSAPRKIPGYAAEVFDRIRKWRHALAQIDRQATATDETVTFTDATGNVRSFPRNYVEVWRRRLTEFNAEATARVKAKDAAWFHWLEEYRRANYETEWSDEFETTHGPDIATSVQRRNSNRAAGAKGGKAKASHGSATEIRKLASGYKGDARGRASWIAKKIGCTARHVRGVLAKAEV